MRRSRYEHLQILDGFYSSSRTCEIGMTWATDKPYRSFWYLSEEASRERN